MTISLVGLMFTAIKGRCCDMKGLMNHIRDEKCCFSLLILIIASIYTHMTSQECPSNHTHESSIARSACLIGLINFIAMWTFTILLLLLSIADCLDCFPSKKQDKSIESKLIGYFPPERDDEIIYK
ncbi:10189_t:CDS:2 [Funneliformis caledonium]|uniref:10189_t:CDS:1 n=1 Tax=Funneliformis caledonium TaxID=1117310 RepID=A0A9N8WG64_9GLOM|nr:10189_t:CDS:2 [Funneliformis caledonium]